MTIEPYELMAKILNPCPSKWLEARPMNRQVGNVRNNDVVLIESLR
ncbi:MAG: hypothetical protein OEU92_22150 [Alphaproteobacteria bacterium]|nr:hypothetical protein [Alphaproteobacteria bacterium]